MVQDEINQSEPADRRAGEESFQGRCAPDHVGIESRDKRDCDDPDVAMTPTELLAKGLRAVGFDRRGIRQAIAKVNQPGSEKKGDAVSHLQREATGPGKKREPGDRNDWSVQANQIQPDGRDGALRRPRIAQGCPRTPQRGVPTK
jgi:hypothetical protein